VRGGVDAADTVDVATDDAESVRGRLREAERDAPEDKALPDREPEWIRDADGERVSGIALFAGFVSGTPGVGGKGW